MKLEIKKLKDSKQYFNDVFECLYEHWGNNNPEYWKSVILYSMGDKEIPCTYVVLNESIFVGTFSIWSCDLMSRQDLYPWLAGIVVKKEFRKLGVGTYIQFQAVSILKNLGIKKAYLFTIINGFYEKTGWTYISDVYDENDIKCRLYEIELGEFNEKRNF